MNLSLKQLLHFVVLCEEQHFGRASERLALSQPALSRSIKTLEDGYGLQLVDRGVGGVNPTRSGRDVLQLARMILQNAAQLDDTVRAEAEGVSGNTFAGFAPIAASLTLEAICTRVITERPGLKFYSNVQPNLTLQEELVSGSFDFIVCPREALRPNNTLDTRSAGKIPLDLIVRGDHPLAGEGAIGLEQLSAYPVLGAHPAPVGRQAWFGTSMRFFDLEFLSLSCDNYDVLARVTKQTDAVWIASRLCAPEDIRSGALKAMPYAGSDVPQDLELVVVTRRDATLSKGTELVIGDVLDAIDALVSTMSN